MNPMSAFGSWEKILLLLVIAVYAGFGLGIEGFASPWALADSTTNFSEKGLLALAMALLVIAGEIDLSVAATMALCSLALGLAQQAGAGLGLMLGAATATGLACGALNGWLVTRLGLPSIVVTIGTLSLYRGLALVVLGDQAYTGYPEALSALGNGTVADWSGLPWLILPNEFLIWLGAALATGVWLHATVYGRRLYALGLNPVAARFSGIEVQRYRLGLFLFAGLMAALAAVLLTGRIGSTRPNLAMGWELDAVTMVILGGVAIEGGRGSIAGTCLAAVLLGGFTFALGMLNVPGIVMSMVVGGLLIGAMVLPRLNLPRRRWVGRPGSPPANAAASGSFN